MAEIVIQLKDCKENPVFGIKGGTSYVKVYGNDVDEVVAEIDNIVNSNSEGNGVGEVRFLCKLPEGEVYSEEWANYLQIKNSKLFENNLQD